MSVRNLIRGFLSRFPVKSFDNLNNLDNNMTKPNTILNLEEKAKQAENIIQELKLEVTNLQFLAEHYKKEREINNTNKYLEVKVENDKLRKEIEFWKNRLIEVEKRNGIQSVTPITSFQPLPVKEESKEVKKEEPSVAEGFTVNASEKQKKDQPKPNLVDGKKVDHKPQTASSEEPPVDVRRLDLKVGKIITVKKHPDADALYVEEVDVGEAKPRTVVSGLVKHVPIEEMQNRMVVLLCNLKPAKMRGVMSEAMVLCASSPEKVEMLLPPPGSTPGDVVHVEGYPRAPDAVLNPKKKIFETVAPDLKTDGSKVATYKGVPFTIPGKGHVTTSSLVGVNIK